MAVASWQKALSYIGCHGGGHGARGCCSTGEDEFLTSAMLDKLNMEGTVAAVELVAPPFREGRAGRNELPREPSPTAGSRSRLQPLVEVPREFDHFCGSAENPADEARRDNLKACLRQFTRTLLRGIRIRVLLDDGRTLLTDASLDSELTHLVLYVPNKQHPVALSSIESVRVSTEVSRSEELAGNHQFVDDRCTTLIIRGGQFLTFVFDSRRVREYFEVCLKVLVLARDVADPISDNPEFVPNEATRVLAEQRPTSASRSQSTHASLEAFNSDALPEGSAAEVAAVALAAAEAAAAEDGSGDASADSTAAVAKATLVGSEEPPPLPD
eukprot:TRINITY_DN13901_c0_g1_i1.p1 TRINITY_DN13901_c0_g1~~TRINITY_DN13901_c0_g1_i1.p1  ORF type:complete len:373 (-),score=72.58 TRINITY_DN13901_c0_g1_i1:42-1025(-)